MHRFHPTQGAKTSFVNFLGCVPDMYHRYGNISHGTEYRDENFVYLCNRVNNLLKYHAISKFKKFWPKIPRGKFNNEKSAPEL